jgi:hypothetical protein
MSCPCMCVQQRLWCHEVSCLDHKSSRPRLHWLLLPGGPVCADEALGASILWPLGLHKASVTSQGLLQEQNVANAALD